MSAGGSRGPGDRAGLVALAGGDRPVRGRIRTVTAVLFDLQRRRVAEVGLVVDDQVPAVLMFAGDPFVMSGAGDGQPLTYLQVQPYRVDAMVTGEVSR